MGFISFAKHFPAFVKTMHRGEFSGDAVILKSSFGKFEPSSRIRDFIESRKHLFPEFSELNLETYPEGSFGAAYQVLMKNEDLMPFRFSGAHKDLTSKNYLPVYYASVHDFFHVLTDYDTSFAGEAGVWAFVAAQGISPQAERAHKIAQALFPIVKPSQRTLIRKAGEEGFQMGLHSQLVLIMNFRDELSKLLCDVRKRYGITPTAISAIKLGFN